MRDRGNDVHGVLRLAGGCRGGGYELDPSADEKCDPEMRGARIRRIVHHGTSYGYSLDQTNDTDTDGYGQIQIQMDET